MSSLLKACCSAGCSLNGAKERQILQPAGFPEDWGSCWRWGSQGPALRPQLGPCGNPLVIARRSDFILAGLLMSTNLIRDWLMH